MELWKESSLETAKLSRETHLVLTHTTHSILELANYCVRELNFSYFLPGYCLSANISVRQVFECEAKLRLQDSLPLVLNSNKYGLIEIKSFDISDACEDKSTPHKGTGSWWFAISTPGCCERCNVRLCGNAKTHLKAIWTRMIKYRKSHASSCHNHHCAAQRTITSRH
ncbi:hypothetical protein PR048_014983, partial [Dryococelus australis]